MSTSRVTDPSGAAVKESNSESINSSRKRKKKRKKAIALQEAILSSVDGALFTGSMSVDPPPAGNSGDSTVTVTTTCRLPKSGRLETSRSGNRPIRVHTQPLLILDLNGVLCHRIRPGKEPSGVVAYRPATDLIAGTRVIPRPDLSAFLAFLDRHFCLALWTSAKPKTARKLMQALIPPPIAKRLLFVWTQTRCEKRMEDQEEVFIKDIAKVWREFPMFNPSNSLILDDSLEKCPVPRNALHPRPLHGQSRPPLVTATKWVSDEANHAAQLDFFHKLVDFWDTHPVTISWDELGDLQNDPQSESLWRFLAANATEHMGWRGKD